MIVEFQESTSAIEARFHLARAAGGTPQGFTLDVDLLLPGRGVTAIFGPSGSGKSTLLRCIAGLERPQAGELKVRGETWQSGRTFLPTHKRPLGYVFQEASLFPHLNARGNLEYAVRRAVPGRAPDWQQVVNLLDLEPLLQRYPQQLSGGERQRVAMARALMINPSLLLMDEPMASLDETRKSEILPYLEKLRDQLDIPILYVSHAVAEIARLAHHLVVLEKGRVAARGDLQQVLAGLQLGEETGVVLQARVEERDARWSLARVSFAGGELWLRDEGDAVGKTLRVRILARDVSLALAEARDSSISNLLQGAVAHVEFDGHPAMCLVRVEVGAAQLVARLTRRSAEQLQLAPGRRVWVQVKSVALVR